MRLDEVHHAARVVALQSAVLALMCELDGYGEHPADGISVTAQRKRDGTVGIDLTYTVAGMAMAGEGM